MDERRKSRGGLVVIFLLACAVLMGLYVAGYFGLGESFTNIDTMRFYPHPLIARFYYPAAMVEAKVTGKEVELFCARDGDFYIRVEP